MRAAPALVALAVIAVAAPAGAQSADDRVVGTWEGYLQAAGLGVVYHIVRAEDGTLGGTMDVPQQGTEGIPLHDVGLAGDTLTMSFSVPGGGSYRGVLSAVGDELTGTFRQGGATLPLTLQKAEGPGGG